jgi:nitrogen fixation-related uncharacterized protein
MNHVLAVAGTLIWVGVNFFVWSLKQDQFVLFWQSLGLGGVMFAALFWYVKGTQGHGAS